MSHAYASDIAAGLHIAQDFLLARVAYQSLLTGKVHENQAAMRLLTISPS